MKFRLQLEELDGRIVPSSSPIALPNAPPAQTPPPTTTIPLPKPTLPFTPIPPLADVPAPKPYVTDFSDTGGRGGTGRAATAAELAELNNLDRQVLAIDIGKIAIKSEQDKLTEQKKSLVVAGDQQGKVVAAAQAAMMAAKNKFDVAPNNTNSDALKLATVNYDASLAALDLMKSILTNYDQRIDYLKAKVVELDALRTKLIARRDAILSSLVRNEGSGARLEYQLPVFIDWNSPEWIGFDKPLPVLKAK